MLNIFKKFHISPQPTSNITSNNITEAPSGSDYTTIPIDFHGGGIGKQINPTDGTLMQADDSIMATFKLYGLHEGDIVEVKNKDYEFKIATYSEEIDKSLIYTYCYQCEENWTTYNHDLDEADIGYQQNYKSDGTEYVRIQLRRCDRSPIPRDAETGDIICIKQRRTIDNANLHPCKSFFADEIRKTATSILKEKERARSNNNKTLTLAILTDTHYVTGGTWDDTLNNLKAVNYQAHFDAVVHLGDLTDGMSTKAVARDYSDKVLNGLRELGIPVYPVVGNHDTNYFKGNPDVLSEEEQAAMYLKDISGHKDISHPWYYIDLNEDKLRLIFLSSFDSREKVRYGFGDNEVSWLEETLKTTSKNAKVLVFAHVPLLPKMHYWSKEIRNSEKILEILRKHNEEHSTILGYIHGHNHCDQINTEYGFPIVSLGCNKIEYFTDYKPEGSITYERKMNTVTQDLWDGLIITSSENHLSFIRFGAGEDRVIKDRRKE